MKHVKLSEVSKVNTSASITSLRHFLPGLHIFPACEQWPSQAALVLFSVRLSLVPPSLSLSLFRVTCLLTGGLIRQLRDRIPSSKIIYFSTTPECFPQICPLPFKSSSLAFRRLFLPDFFTLLFLIGRPSWCHLSLVSHEWLVLCTRSCCVVLSVKCRANFSWLLKQTPTRCRSFRLQ